jgi:hypothetical protein
MAQGGEVKLMAQLPRQIAGLVPVEGNPFAEAEDMPEPVPTQTRPVISGGRLEEVTGDPFAEQAQEPYSVRNLPDPGGNSLIKYWNLFNSQLEEGRKNIPALGRSALQGLLFHGYDEAKAQAKSALTGRPYSEVHKEEMARDEAIPTRVRVAGNVLGALPTAVVAPAKLLTPFLKGSSAVKRGLTYAATGTAEGALAGGLYAKPEERKKGITTGAKFGFAFGAGAPLLMKGIGAGWTLVGEKLSRLPVPDKWGGEAGQASEAVRAWAVRKIIRAARRDGFEPHEALTHMETLAPGATLADVGPNLTATAGVLHGRPGAGKALIEQTLEDRNIAQFPQITRMLEDQVNLPGRIIVPVIEKAAAYRAALQQHVPLTNTLRRLMDRDSGRRAWKEGQKIAREKHNIEVPDLDTVLHPRPDQPAAVGIRTELLHWMKMGMDDVLEKSRDPVKGIMAPKVGKNLFNAMQQTRKQFRSEVRFHNKEYGKLLDLDSYNYRLSDAHEKGYGFLKLKNDRLVAQQIAALRSPAEKRAYQQGALDAIYDKTVPAADAGFDVATTIIRMNQKLKRVFGNEKAEKIVTTMRQYRDLRRTTTEIIGGSQTAPRLAAQAEFEGSMPGVVADTMRGRPQGAIDAAATKIYKWFTTPGEEVSDEAAKILMTMTPQQRAILAREFNQRMNPELMQRGITGLNTGGAIVASPNIPNIYDRRNPQ